MIAWSNIKRGPGTDSVPVEYQTVLQFPTPETPWGWFDPAEPDMEPVAESGWQRWRLLEPLTYHRSLGVSHTAATGMVTDGASIPWILAPLAGQRMTGMHLLPAFIHDELCERADELGGSAGLRVRQYADRIFPDMIRAAGGSRWSAWSKGCAVRLGTLWAKITGKLG